MKIASSFFKVCCALTAGLVLISNAQADIVTFEFDGITENTSLNFVNFQAAAPTDPAIDAMFAENVSVSSIGFGAGLNSATLVELSGAFQIAGGNGLSAGVHGTFNVVDLDAAHTAGDYIDFSLAAAPGFVLDLATFDFELGRGARGPNDYAIRTSVDGFASNLVAFDDAIAPNAAGGVPGAQAQVDLSGSEFQGLSAFTLRIVVDDRENDGLGSSSAVFDNFVLGGIVTVAVPEPSSLTLLWFAGLGWIPRRRK